MEKGRDDESEKMKRDDMMKKMDKDKMNKESMMNKEYSMGAAMTPEEKSLASLAGTYTGQSALLTQSLGFPKTTFVLNKADMTLEAEGLDLALLQKPEFQVGGVYPKAKLAAKGKVAPKTDGSVDLVVTSLTPMFVVTANGNDTVLDTAASQAILAGLAKAGIVIPTISDTAPATIPATVTATPTGISIKSSPTSSLFAMFEGTKK